MDSKLGFEMSLIVIEAIRGRCANIVIPTARVSDVFGGQTNSYILVAHSIDNTLTPCAGLPHQSDNKIP